MKINIYMYLYIRYTWPQNERLYKIHKMKKKTKSHFKIINFLCMCVSYTIYINKLFYVILYI